MKLLTTKQSTSHSLIATDDYFINFYVEYFQATIDEICNNASTLSISPYLINSPSVLTFKVLSKVSAKATIPEPINDAVDEDSDDEDEVLDSYHQLQDYERLRSQQVRVGSTPWNHVFITDVKLSI